MTIDHKLILKEVEDYFFITLGLVLYTIAFTVFLMPYQIVAGGVTGLSAIIYYATGFHLENTYIMINGSMPSLRSISYWCLPRNSFLCKRTACPSKFWARARTSCR